jgi:hypothetical protein
MEKELNEEYISLISQMRELNKKRVGYVYGTLLRRNLI